MTLIIFLGPSLPLDHARSILSATYLPPVQQGDILRVVQRHKPTMIGIVDGFFETVPAVWHKEILFALKEGVHVFGAASMGALRAAELHTFGMKGVGKIFEWYRDGVIEADDEVAISHGPSELGHIPLTQSLVDIRHYCELAVDANLISIETKDRLIAVGRSIHYKDRSVASVTEKYEVAYGGSTEVVEWQKFCGTFRHGLKALDAVLLLETMRDFDLTAIDRCDEHWDIERTVFFERLRNEVALVAALERSSLRDIAPPQSEQLLAQLRQEALLIILARKFAAILGWQLDRLELSEIASRFFIEIGALDEPARAKWMQDRSITPDIFWRFMNDRSHMERLTRTHLSEIDQLLPDLIRLRL